VRLILLVILTESLIAGDTDAQCDQTENQQSWRGHANILPEEYSTRSFRSFSNECASPKAEAASRKHGGAAAIGVSYSNTSKAARNLAAFHSAQRPGGGETTCSD
jgi:hypothetical protein